MKSMFYKHSLKSAGNDFYLVCFFFYLSRDHMKDKHELKMYYDSVTDNITYI